MLPIKGAYLFMFVFFSFFTGSLQIYATVAHRHHCQLPPNQIASDSTFQLCKSVELSNTDTVKVSDFVLCTPNPSHPQSSIAEVLEMLHIISGANRYIYILLQLHAVSGVVMPYRCPRITPQHPGGVILVKVKVCLMYSLHL